MNEPIVPRLDFGQDDAPSTSAIHPMPMITAKSMLHVSPEQRRLHYLHQEYAAIAKDPIEGIYITPSARNPFEWFGVLIVRVGIYSGGMFRFTLTIPSDFPDTTIMPVVKFEDNIFHPLIRPKTNIADFGRYFPSGWQRDRNHIYQVLAAVQGMFFRCKTDEPAKAPNAEAALLIRDELHKFKQLAREAVRQSRTQIYGAMNTDDENAINFTPWNIELEPFREFLIGQLNMDELSARSPRSASLLAASKIGSRNKKRGLSWVDADHCQYMCALFPPVKAVSESRKFTSTDTNEQTATDTKAENDFF